MYLKVEKGLHLTANARFIFGRFVVLSRNGQQLVSYTNAQAVTEGLTLRTLARALKELQQLNKIKEVYKRTFEVETAKETISVVIPVEYLQKKDIRLSMNELLILGRLLFLSQANEVITYSATTAKKELDVSKNTLSSALHNLEVYELISTKIELHNNSVVKLIELDKNLLLYKQKLDGLGDKIDLCSDLSHAKIDPPICQNCTTPHAKIGISSLYSRINNMNNMNRENKKEKSLTLPSYPKTVEEVLPYFFSYAEKHKKVIPLLATVDLSQPAIAFFNYFSSKGWKDKNNKPVLSVQARVATWMSYVDLRKLPKLTSTRDESIDRDWLDLRDEDGRTEKDSAEIEAEAEVVEDSNGLIELFGDQK